jgi:peptide/nickel transport system substrate-binding protein/microcin C transport system substrate-binding protein
MVQFVFSSESLGIQFKAIHWPTIGGNFALNIGGEPLSVHPLMAADLFARRVHDFTMDSLADYNNKTYELEPRLAERWEISKDGKEFTFYLRKNLKFHDGQPITAEDVKFSFEVVLQPNSGALIWREAFENIETVTAIDPLTVKFVAKNTYYKNLEQIATTFVIPKHVYGDPAKSKKMQYELVGSGPYKLDRFVRGENAILTRFSDWYGSSEEQFRNRYNFETITAWFIQDESVAIEKLERGELDYSDLRAEAFQTMTNQKPWGTKIKKVRYSNAAPKSWYFYGWNHRNALFRSKNARLALSRLMDREGMIKKYLPGLAKVATAPMWFQSPTYPEGLKPLSFDPIKAKKLLIEDGWLDENKNGIIEKTGDCGVREFKFTLIHSNRDLEKFHEWYREDLRKLGIIMEVKYLPWKEFEAAIRLGKFDAAAMAWAGGDPEQDPKQIWHSASIESGGNFIRYNNPEVDQMIEDARYEPNRYKRIKLLRKIYAEIAKDAPYTFWFNNIYEFYGVSSRVHRSADTLRYKVGIDSWWLVD